MSPKRKAVRTLVVAAKLEYFMKHHARPDVDYIAIWYGPAAGRWYRDQKSTWRFANGG